MPVNAQLTGFLKPLLLLCVWAQAGKLKTLSGVAHLYVGSRELNSGCQACG